MIVALLGICLAAFAQDYYNDFGFVRDQSVSVISNSIALKHAWAGGVNSVRFSEIDLDLDGEKDLFLFEKNGNRILPFINIGGTPRSYRYAPEYVKYFPALHDWAILADYDQDGKEDIFTYSIGGIAVYRNISDGELKFEKVSDQLQAYYYNGYSNLYASSNDYPAIVDVDGDGDLDFLNFWLLGKYVHYIRNMSVEEHQTPGLFDLRLEDECWGKFAEGEDNNEITLFVNCDDKDGGEFKHVGSSMYAFDFTNNGLMDVIIGDVDYPGVVYLENGGTPEEALMISQTSDFPNSHTPIHLFSMPAVSLLEVTGDGIPDLIASPSDPSLTKSQNVNSLWLYEYQDITEQYELTTTAFLQSEMIDVGSGAYPVFYDWDGDGLQDLFIGNYGIYDSSRYVYGFLESFYSSSIHYYRNTGTAENPAFTLVSDDFGDLRRYGYHALYPAFGDFNGDGKMDLLCGREEGDLLLFINQNDGEIPLFLSPQISYQNINVGNFSTPQYFDLDRDGKKDLLIGNRKGRISYYKNTVSGNIPEFELATDFLGEVNVCDENISYFGYSTPCFFRNNQGETVLFCGSEQGSIYYYNYIDGNLDGSFTLALESMHELYGTVRHHIKEGTRVAPCVGDLNNDSWPDLVVGNWAGGLAWFFGTEPPDSTTKIAKEIANSELLTIFPNPANNYFQIKNSSEFSLQGKSLSLYDITGKVVLVKRLNGDNPIIDISSLSQGFYMGLIAVEQELFRFKVLVKR